jgi:hypothetical protein
MNKKIYMAFLMVLIYFFGTFLYEAITTIYVYSCGKMTTFCDSITGMVPAVQLNIHVTLLEIRVAISLLALSIWGWVGYKYAFQ